jgi:ABC-type oligopeptide transport system ATPase subunit
VLQQTGLFVDVLRLGLNTVLTPNHSDEELVSRIIRVRKNFQASYGKQLSDYVEFIDESRYLYHSSISENLILGTPHREDFLGKNVLKNPYLKTFFDRTDLTRPLLDLGADLARQTVDIVGNLPPDEVFFEQSPIRADEVEDFKALTKRLKKSPMHQLSANDREMLLDLALRFAPGKHKMVALPGSLEKTILEGRLRLRERISQDDPTALSFYNISQYMYFQTILNNILFGKTKSSTPQSQEKINQSIIQLLIAEDLLEVILAIGMKFPVGSKGDKLSGGQRQKLAIARILLKDPKIIVLDEATSALDNNSQARIQNLLESKLKGRTTVLAVMHRLDVIKKYDKIAVMKTGKIIELGGYDELMARKGVLYELVHGKK